MHRRAERAQTLVRTGLKKPVNKLSAGVGHFSGSSHPEREIRAKTTPKHVSVDRFGSPKAPARPAPLQKAVSGELVRRNSQSRSAHQAAAPLPSMVASASHQKLERLLDHALTNADTHKEALRYQAARHFWQRRRMSGGRRWLALGGALIVIIVGLLAAWEKVPILSVKTAGIRAHLNPSVPSYTPDSYKLAGPAKAVSGTVDIKYVSSTDSSSSYEIIQAGSNLTSSSVGQSVVPKGAAVQTSQVNGNTVYLYGKANNAVWVNDGVLYTIKDNANLSSDELIKIVQGLNP